MSAVDGITTVEVNYTAGDILAGTSRRWRRWLVIILVSFTLLAGVVPIINWIDGWPLGEAVRWINWPLVLAITAGVPVWLIVVALGHLWVSRRRGRDRSFHLTLVDEGLQIDSKLGESLIFWPTFTRVSASANRLFFLMEGQRGMIIVPARVFASRKAFEHWVEVATSRFESVRTG